jgi:hypothetical protein
MCFLGLALYVGGEEVVDLPRKAAPPRSISGIALAVVSLIVMPLLSRAKKNVGRALGSAAMRAGARQTDFCVDSAGRPSAQGDGRMVVGRSGGGARNGANYREGRIRWN